MEDISLALIFINISLNSSSHRPVFFSVDASLLQSFERLSDSASANFPSRFLQFRAIGRFVRHWQTLWPANCCPYELPPHASATYYFQALPPHASSTYYLQTFPPHASSTYYLQTLPLHILFVRSVQPRLFHMPYSHMFSPYAPSTHAFNAHSLHMLSALSPHTPSPTHSPHTPTLQLSSHASIDPLPPQARHKPTLSVIYCIIFFCLAVFSFN